MRNRRPQAKNLQQLFHFRKESNRWMHILTDREHENYWSWTPELLIVNTIITHREHQNYHRERLYYDREHL